MPERHFVAPWGKCYTLGSRLRGGWLSANCRGRGGWFTRSGAQLQITGQANR